MDLCLDINPIPKIAVLRMFVLVVKDFNPPRQRLVLTRICNLQWTEHPVQLLSVRYVDKLLPTSLPRGFVPGLTVLLGRA